MGSLLLVGWGLLPCLCFGQTQTRDVLCIDGYVGYQSTFSATGVTVRVGPAKTEGLAHRVCTATLSWSGKNSVTVVPESASIDVDVLGTDLGLGAPVVALSVKRSKEDSKSIYEIYSLKAPPRLLRTIAGGDSYRARDTDLDGRVEIWTHDASAIDGFDGLDLSAFEFAPTLVLRFEPTGLVDASYEFQSHYDEQIAAVRKELTPQALADFRKTDGRLADDSGLRVEDEDGLLATKVRVLEIVFAYLYSGREKDAWEALATMWPAADADRMRAAIISARGNGIRTQVQSTETLATLLKAKPKLKAHIYSCRQPQDGNPLGGLRENLITDTAPVTIDEWFPSDLAPYFSSGSGPEYHVVVDAAGKIGLIERVKGKEAQTSDQMALNAHIDHEIQAAAAGWKYIPAFADSRPTACEETLTITFPH